MRKRPFLNKFPRRLTTVKSRGVSLILMTILPIVGLSQELHKFKSLDEECLLIVAIQGRMLRAPIIISSLPNSTAQSTPSRFP